MKRLKLLYLIDQINLGGTEKQLLAVIERLDRAKFEPYLVCLRPTDYLERCNINCRTEVLNVSSLISRNGITKLFRFLSYLKQEEIDIVQTFFFDSTFFGVIAGRLARVKCVLSTRRDMGFWYNKKLLSVLYIVNFFTDRIVVNSEAIKTEVSLRERVKRDKIDVIYNGVDLEPFKVFYDVNKLRTELGIPSTDLIIGIVANLNRHVKRVDIFVDAAAKLLEEVDNISFIVVGDGSFRDGLERQAANLFIAEKLHFVGSQNNVIPYLQLFDIGVLTSESEGFPNSIIEYMAASLPVVCFDSGGNKELIEDGVNGFTVKNQSPLDLSVKLMEIISNGIDHQSLVDFNEKKLGSFNWENKIKKVADYCLNIVSI